MPHSTKDVFTMLQRGRLSALLHAASLAACGGGGSTIPATSAAHSNPGDPATNLPAAAPAAVPPPAPTGTPTPDPGNPQFIFVPEMTGNGDGPNGNFMLVTNPNFQPPSPSASSNPTQAGATRRQTTSMIR
jgi:hypothetical protein